MILKLSCFVGIVSIASTLVFHTSAQAAIPATEREALIALYNSTGGDVHWSSKTNWLKAPGVFNDAGTECSWFGVQCHASGATVVGLHLADNQLYGVLPPELGVLSNLQELDLSGNWRTESIPPELGNLAHLRYLDLSGTGLFGSIPGELGNLTELSVLLLEGCGLEGAIPPELGNLSNLTVLSLRNNFLTGSIPHELGNLSKLTVLSLPNNLLTGLIPRELGNLSNLTWLDLESNGLMGSIPPELGNLSELTVLDLSCNPFLGGQLTGPIPSELGNLTSLRWLNLSYNGLTGAMPPELGKLVHLQYMYLYKNRLTGFIPPELGNAANLLSLDLSFNGLTGGVPPELGKLTSLLDLTLSVNLLTGAIPPELGNLAELVVLSLDFNQLTGPIPAELGKLAHLQGMYLYANQLTSIPPELGNLAELVDLSLDFNQLTGPIPAELGKLAHLKYMFLYANRLTGSIPPELGNLRELRELALHSNQLTGALPPELGGLASVTSLNVSDNQLTGPIPSDFDKLANLSWLILSNNGLTGAIPPELGALANLTRLDLGNNDLTGAVPCELAQLIKLYDLNLRSNHLFNDRSSLRQFLSSRNNGDWESSQTLFRTFAQFGDGGGLFSQVVLFNLNDVSAATGQVAILGDSGDAVSVDLNGELAPGTRNVSVPAAGLVSLRTDGLGEVQTGSVRVTTDRHVEGVVIFGGGIGLAGVGSGPEFPTGFVAPMQRDVSRGIDTGIAVTVSGDSEAHLDLTLLSAGGGILARASETLAARGHKAFFVTEVPWDAAVDFSDFTGTLVVTASQAVSGTVLQTRPGEFVTLPVAPLQSLSSDGASAEHRLHFAQFAEGAGDLSSQILLFNPGEKERAKAEITLRDSTGAPMTVDLNGEAVAGVREVEIGPGALMALTTDGLGKLQVGSVAVTSDQPLAGVILFAGPAVGAAGVGSSLELSEGFVAPMETDLAGGINTGVAVMSLETAGMTLDVDLLASDGQRLASAEVALAALGHAALFVTDLQWDHPVDFSHFQGLLRVQAGGRTAATVIQTRPGQFATMPVVPKPAD